MNSIRKTYEKMLPNLSLVHTRLSKILKKFVILMTPENLKNNFNINNKDFFIQTRNLMLQTDITGITYLISEVTNLQSS